VTGTALSVEIAGVPGRLYTIDVNLTGYLLTLEHAIPHMIAAGGGSVSTRVWRTRSPTR
jgi:hypothetical protein